jgi:hypothetical protein
VLFGGVLTVASIWCEILAQIVDHLTLPLTYTPHSTQLTTWIDRLFEVITEKYIEEWFSRWEETLLSSTIVLHERLKVRLTCTVSILRKVS